MKRRILTSIGVGIFAVAINACSTEPEGDSRLRFSEAMKLAGLTQEDSIGTGQTGSLECPQILSCLSLCSDSDFACALSCFGTGSAQGQQDILALLTCTQDAADACGTKCVYVFGDACEACVNAQCQAEINTCVAADPPPPPSTPDAGAPPPPPSPDAGTPDAQTPPPPPSTGYSCIDIHDCLYSCGVLDETCVSDCHAAASPTAQSQFVTLYQCVDNAASNLCVAECGSTDAEWASEQCQTCLYTACSKEVDDCFNYVAPAPPNPPAPNPPTPTPTQTCADIMSCLSSCMDDTCANNCVRDASPDAQALFISIMDCGQAAIAGNCQTDCQNLDEPACNTCMNTECATEISACLGNSGP